MGTLLLRHRSSCYRILSNKINNCSCYAIKDKYRVPVLGNFPAVNIVTRELNIHTVATVQNRTTRLLELLESAKNDKSRLIRLEELNEHFLRFFLSFCYSLFNISAVSHVTSCKTTSNKIFIVLSIPGYVCLHTKVVFVI